MLRKDPFLKLIKELGNEKAMGIQNLRITWGQGESLCTGDWYGTGGHAVSIMSVPISLWLPDLRHVRLKGPLGFGERNTPSGKRADESIEEFDERAWPEALKEEMMGAPDGGVDELEDATFGGFIKGVKQIMDAAPNLEELVLEN